MPHKFRLSAIAQETKEVKTFRFEPLTPFTFKAGQFVILNYQGEKRAYSISSHPYDHFVDLTIRIGPESYFPKKLERLKVGDVVEMDGPYGHFVLSGSGREAVFIGAGVGIAGLRALWTEYLQKRPRRRITILYSARSADEIIWKSQLESLAPNAKIIFTLTRDQPAGWRGETGRVNADLLRRHISNPIEKEFYICGPPEMVEAIKTALLGLGVPEEQIFAESWGGITNSI